MGDRRMRSLAMKRAQYQASLATGDAEMNNEEAKFANSLMQYEHYVGSSYRDSVTGCSFVQRDRKGCHDRMMKDYFIERPRYPSCDFQRRYRMRREFFESILNAVVHHDHYFAEKDRCHRPIKSITSLESHICIQMLANGCFADSIDKYCGLAKSTAIENLKRFCKTIEAIYGATYLRKPNHEDLKRLPWHDRKSRLHGLGVKELSYCLGWPIQGSAAMCTKIIEGPLNS